MPAQPFSPNSFQTFGELLRYLRRRERLTQLELSIAVGYSEAQIGRLEQNQRRPDLTALKALFIPALQIDNDPELTARLLELAQREATGAAWKRLGFLAERLWPNEPKLADTARRHLSTGLARLDPGIAQRGKLSKRWRLWINVGPSELATSPDRT